MIDFKQKLSEIKPKVGGITFIAVDGHGGSGKSTLAKLLSEKFGAEIIHTDDFAGWDNPLNWWQAVVQEVFEPIQKGVTSLSYHPASWWENHHPEPIENQPVTSVMILEGVCSSRKEFDEYISLRFFVDTPKEVCLKRGIERDKGTGKSVEELTKMWEDWFKEEDKYFERDNPKIKADVVTDGTRPFEEQIVLPSESKQFSNSFLVSAYDSINALGDDADFWLREVKRLSPKAIIDFGCGTGLLTCQLAEQGYETIGIDPFRGMLEIAKQKQYANKVIWVEGDYRKIEGLRADLFLMTSHVAQFLLSDEEWQGMLVAAHNALTSDGHILFDSRRSLKETFAKWPTEISKRNVTDAVLGEIECWHNVVETTDVLATYELHYHFKKSNETVVSTDTIIFRSKVVIERSLREAGFIVQTVYGDWDSSPFTETSPEMLFVAQRS